jgi:hypothetical protein
MLPTVSKDLCANRVIPSEDFYGTNNYACWLRQKMLEVYTIHPTIIFMARRPLVDQGVLIVETLLSHSETPYSVGLLWTSDQPD